MEATEFNNFQCAKATENFISGTRFSEKFKYTQLEISYCSGKNCKDPTIIKDTINRLKLQFSYLDTYFDGDNLDTPLIGSLDFSVSDGLKFGELKLS